jgi:hypothetical protein
MARQLQARRARQARAPQPRDGSITGSLRAALAERGPLSARELADHIHRPTGRIGALLKWDMAHGRVQFRDGLYSLTSDTTGGQ